ncbi:MAG TPA: phage holin family protein [Dehalococcoidia bacterium]|nr:phage holin family protein [Dehalococcoidia bacterium]
MYRPTTQTRIAALVIRWLLLALCVWLAAEIVAGIHLEGLESTLAVAAILGLLNLYVRPIIVLLSLPLTILTLGLFLIVVNAALLGIADLLANLFDLDFAIEGVGAALLGALIISIANLVLSAFVNADRLARQISGQW